MSEDRQGAANAQGRTPNMVTFRADGSVSSGPMPPEMYYNYIVQKATRKIEREPNDPDNREWYAERGKALMGLGKFAEAIPDFTVLINIYPSYGLTYGWRGLCYSFSGDGARALDDLRQYKVLSHPKDLDADILKLLEALESAAQRPSSP